MNIGIQTWGSEGDVRPFLALAAGLRAAGHDVTLAVTRVMIDVDVHNARLLDIKEFESWQRLGHRADAGVLIVQ